MKKLRKFCLWISILLFVLACFILFMSFVASSNSSTFFTLAIYVYTSAAFFAAPYMVIPGDEAKTRFDALMIMGSSGFYAIALLLALVMGLPYIHGVTTHESSAGLWEQIAQIILAISFVASLLMHCWSTLSNAKKMIFSAAEKTEET